MFIFRGAIRKKERSGSVREERIGEETRIKERKREKEREKERKSTYNIVYATSNNGGCKYSARLPQSTDFIRLYSSRTTTVRPSVPLPQRHVVSFRPNRMRLECKDRWVHRWCHNPIYTPVRAVDYRRACDKYGDIARLDKIRRRPYVIIISPYYY